MVALGEDSHANMLRDQMNRLLSCNNVVRVFGADSLTSRRVHDCVMNDGVNSSRQQNPFIFCQVLEHDVFLLGSRVGLWENGIERRQSEWHGCDLRVLRRCRDQRQIQFAGHDTPDQLG